MQPTIGLSPSEAFQLLCFLASLSMAFYLMARYILPGFDKKGTIWRYVPAAAIGVDAAERGDTRRLLLEKIPYDLQKRAILHKRWLMIGHESQWTKPGEYRTFNVAEIPLVVIRGEDGKLRAFHNVCRHRAYTVVRKTSGKSLRLFCRYHGWQYDSTGRLLKAPCFPTERPDVLNISENGLFGIHLKIDSGRFIFVNFATSLADAFPWSDISPSRLRTLDFGIAEEWELEVESDWRLASLLPWFIDPSSFSSLSPSRRFLGCVLSPTANTCLQYVDDASFICDVAGKYNLLVSALPKNDKRTVVRMTMIPQSIPKQQCEGPRNGRTAAAVHQLLCATSSCKRYPKTATDFSREQVNAEIRSAIAALQRHRTTNTNLDYRQSAIRERLDKFNRHVWHHKALEKAAGKRINAVARVTGFSSEDVEAEAICDALEGRVGNIAAKGDMSPPAGCLAENMAGGLEW